MTQKTNVTIEDRRAAAADRERTGSVVMGERMKVKKRSTFETLIKFGTDACEYFPPSNPLPPSRTQLRSFMLSPRFFQKLD